jgi:hypothetical protein
MTQAVHHSSTAYREYPQTRPSTAAPTRSYAQQVYRDTTPAHKSATPEPDSSSESYEQAPPPPSAAEQQQALAQVLVGDETLTPPHTAVAQGPVTPPTPTALIAAAVAQASVVSIPGAPRHEDNQLLVVTSHAPLVASLPNPTTTSGAETEEEDQLELPADQTDQRTITLLPKTGELLVGAIPLDLSNLAQGVEAFFVRLGEDFRDPLTVGNAVRRLAPWLLTAAVATAGLELALWQARKAARQGRDRPVPLRGGDG